MPDANGIIAAKRSAQSRLLAIPGVSSVGVGPKLVNGERTGELAIVVVVTRKRIPNEIPSDERVPAQIEGFKTDVLEGGPALPHSSASGSVTPQEDTKKYDVLRGGIQISVHLNPNERMGTLGCIAYLLPDKRPVLVTCEHVLHTPPETTLDCAHSVGQPLGHDCCECMDFCKQISGHETLIVAHERQQAVFSNDVDGAVAELVAGTKWAAEIQDEPDPIRIRGTHAIDVLDLPVDPDDPMLRYDVYKRGRTTRKTRGWVHCVDYSGKLDYGTSASPVVRNYDHAIFVWTDADQFSDTGDSGSAVMNVSHDEVVGLHFAGQGVTDPKTGRRFRAGIASAIDKVQNELRLDIATAANTCPGVQTVQRQPPLSPRRGELPLPRQVISSVPASPTTITPESRAGPELWWRLTRTPLGQELVRAASRHRDEIRTLARTRARVIVGWRRYGGLHILRQIQANAPIIPADINGRSFAESVRRFAEIVLLYASDELAADIRRYATVVETLGGLTYSEVVAAFGDHGP